jgi:exodeoxyribonuclease VII small subunit
MNSENKKINFEKSMERIEDIIKKLEDNDLDLETAMNLYKEGIELTSTCYNKINEVEAQSIKILEQSDISKLQEVADNEEKE